MSDRPYSRRDFLLSVGIAGAAGTVLAACGGDDAPSSAETPQAGSPDAATSADPNGVVAAECPGYDQLTEDDLSVRRTLNYTDTTPEPGQRCDNCRFQNDAAEFGPCIGCQLFAGPVAPGGWCSSWAAVT